MKPHCIRCALSLTLVMTLLGGCGGYRMIIDIVPVTNRLVETTVIEDDKDSWGAAAKVAMIDVTGVISDGGNGPNPLESGESPVSLFAEALKKAAEDDRVKAIIVAINSPGGTVTASDLMYRELKYFKETTGKPVGADIRRKKNSFPVVHAMSEAKGAEKKSLLDIYNQDEVAESDVDRVLQIMEKAETRGFAHAMATEHGKDATDALESVELEPTARAEIDEMIHFLLVREH